MFGNFTERNTYEAIVTMLQNSRNVQMVVSERNYRRNAFCTDDGTRNRRGSSQTVAGERSLANAARVPRALLLRLSRKTCIRASSFKKVTVDSFKRVIIWSNTYALPRVTWLVARYKLQVVNYSLGAQDAISKSTRQLGSTHADKKSSRVVWYM